MKFQVQFLQVQGGQIAQFDVLEVLPCSLHRIQVRRICGQALDPHATRDGGLEKVRNQHSPMDRRPILDDQQTRAEVPDQMLEKLDGARAVQRLLKHQQVELADWCNAAHDREVISCLPLVEDRGVGLGAHVECIS